MTRKELVNAIGLTIGLAGIAFVARTVIVRWDEFSAILADTNLAWMCLALASALLAMALIAFNWSRLLRNDDHDTDVLTALQWYLIGQLGKYVPGGVWSVLGPSELAVRSGVQRRSAYAATLASMASTLLAALLFAAGTGLTSPEGRIAISAPIAVGLAVVGVAITVPSIRRFGKRFAERIAPRTVELPTSASAITQIGRHLPVWVLMSATNILVVVSLGASVDIGLAVDIAFVTTLSWAVGFVIVGVPGGIGVREAAFVALMSEPLGESLAVSVAVAGRMATIAADLLGAVLAVSSKQLLRRLRAEPATAAPLASRDGDR